MKKTKMKKRIVSFYLPTKLIDELNDHVKKTCGNVSWWIERAIIAKMEKEKQDVDG